MMTEETLPYYHRVIMFRKMISMAREETLPYYHRVVYEDDLMATGETKYCRIAHQWTESPGTSRLWPS